MPLQNRVDPFGNICFSSERGSFMGNRGHLHNQDKKIIRPWQLKRWIICVLDFKERNREVMKKGHYTELFFLDEATALAAGHRPCAECQRERLNVFKKHWTTANEISIKSLAEMDDYLHLERTNPIKPEIRLKELPDGVIVTYQSKMFLKYANSIREWSFGGYGESLVFDPDLVAKVLTPMSVVRAIDAGYLIDFTLTSFNILQSVHTNNV